jgi:glycosyltransferase involved in cell wall biosynthesis
MKLGIIIPCFNEEDKMDFNIFKKCLKTYLDFQLCFVNNGSTDGTLNLLSTFQKKYRKRVTVIDMKKKKGNASAIKVGSRFLYSIKKIKHVGYIEPNLFKDFNKFNTLIEELKLEKEIITVYNKRSV